MKRLFEVAGCLLAFGFLYIGYLLVLGPYVRGNKVASQGRELLGRIESYRKRNGHYPDQAWFNSLGQDRFTIESRIWTYFTPARETSEGDVLLMVPLDYRPRYSFGFAATDAEEGCILNWSAESLQWLNSTGEKSVEDSSEQDVPAKSDRAGG